MAPELRIGSTPVKTRSPLAVFLLSLVTLGIYYCVWYYKINRELRDAARIDVSPFVALVAITVGWLVIVPPFVSWYRTFERIQQAQRGAGPASGAKAALGFTRE